MTYGNVHRFFLRTIASRGVLSVTDAQTVLEKFNGEEDLSVSDLVKAINDEIRPYYQEIKITKDEVTNEDVIVFLSLADDAATKAQNIFSATELEYFRVLIEQIMSTDSRQITRINAINLVSRMKSNLTKSDAQEILNTWCRMRYFDKEEDNYALGVRAIHEFEGYFRQNMPDTVEECVLCKHIVFRGYNCPGCALAVHTRCLTRYLEKVQKWPCCKIDFEQAQLESMRNESCRLPVTQLSDTTRHSEEYNTMVEPTQDTESSEMMNETDVIPEISQRVSRKRKRQILSQSEVPTTIEEEPSHAPTRRHSTRNTTAEEATKVPTTRHSIRNTIAEEPTKASTTRHSTRSTILEEPIKALTIGHSTRNTSVEEPTKAPTRHSTRNKIVEEPPKTPTTRHSTRNTIVEEPTKAPTTRHSTRNTIVEEPAKVQEEIVPQAEVTQRVTRKRKQQN